MTNELKKINFVSQTQQIKDETESKFILILYKIKDFYLSHTGLFTVIIILIMAYFLINGVMGIIHYRPYNWSREMATMRNINNFILLTIFLYFFMKIQARRSKKYRFSGLGG